MSVYVFGYGALINLAKTYEIKIACRKKIYPVVVHGLKRSLNVLGGTSEFQYKVMGVKDVKTAKCNGILFKVTEKELSALIAREQLYTLKSLDSTRILFAYKHALLPKALHFKPADKIVCFYPQTKYVLPKKDLTAYPVKPGYLKICLDGAAEYGIDFFEDFLASLKKDSTIDDNLFF
jgi:hypothetical protein